MVNSKGVRVVGGIREREKVEKREFIAYSFYLIFLCYVVGVGFTDDHYQCM